MVAKHKNNEVFFEDYTKLKPLGSGSYASVFKVRHNNLGYVRAIKILNQTLDRGEDDPIFEKFIDECRLLLRLGNGCHPNIVRIYHPLLRSHHALVEMDYIDGEDLYKYLERETFIDVNEIINLAKNIGSALAYCHVDVHEYCLNGDENDFEVDPDDAGKIVYDREKMIKKYRVVHNDMHSRNIMRAKDGRYVLLDFGLSIEGNSVVRKSQRENGAPEYKAPEKWDSAEPTPETDIYGFGVILYEMLAGQVPFKLDKKNRNSIEAEYRLSNEHKNNKPPQILELRKKAFEKKNPGKKYDKDYPDWLEELILKCLEKKPEDRFADGKELYEFVKEHNSLKNEIERLRAELNEVCANAGKLPGLGQRSLEKLQVEKANADKKIKSLEAEVEKLQALLTAANKTLPDPVSGSVVVPESPVSVDLISLRREWRGVKARAVAAADNPNKAIGILRKFYSVCMNKGAVDLTEEVEKEIVRIKSRSVTTDAADGLRKTKPMTSQMVDLMKNGKLDEVKILCRKNGNAELLRKITRLQSSRNRISHLEKSIEIYRLTRDADKINNIINELKAFIALCDEVSYPVSEFKTLLSEYSKILK